MCSPPSIDHFFFLNSFVPALSLFLSRLISYRPAGYCTLLLVSVTAELLERERENSFIPRTTDGRIENDIS